MSVYATNTDQELAILLKKGERGVFAFVYNRYKADLYLHALRIIKNQDDATDLVQEVFTNLWEKRKNFVLSTTIANYLYGAVRNRVFNFIEHRNITERYARSMQSFFEKGEFFTDNLIREKELAVIIEREINALPKKMREVFLMSRNTDLSHKEIGEILGISDTTVKKQIVNAVRLLRLKINLSILFYYFF
ncbi:RNA polymerase sigma-70 factor, ECF subfamily [Pedobacter steynii]|uniref:RNA polymerase sigma-70 factor, ECF subfamily n=1 Tax=Pedobacter steynii TaxID=430522 RepID=A0A1G9NUZ8_9SPHI|nr:RNA polymerase sigma-70 factor [Pedobacter steynii]NQX39183.1 RNA polymerase sigma-70 factor [Pedobacter steynii]SDL90220.1 RNA polymerase sigma-70 factor, ECF subfamily [Pedobacter steynii]